MPRIFRMITGVIFILIGIASFFLPFSPGTLFLLLGLILLGSKKAADYFRKAHKTARYWLGPKTGKLFLFLLAHLEEPPKQLHFQVTRKHYKQTRNPRS